MSSNSKEPNQKQAVNPAKKKRSFPRRKKPSNEQEQTGSKSPAVDTEKKVISSTVPSADSLEIKKAANDMPPRTNSQRNRNNNRNKPNALKTESNNRTLNKEPGSANKQLQKSGPKQEDTTSGSNRREKRDENDKRGPPNFKNRNNRNNNRNTNANSGSQANQTYNEGKNSTVTPPPETKRGGRNFDRNTANTKKRIRKPKTPIGPRLVIRRLPPSLKEDEFLSDLPEDLKEFFQYYKMGSQNINNPFEDPICSRAYFQFPFTNEEESVALGKYLVSANYILGKYKPNAKLEKCTFSYRPVLSYREARPNKTINTLQKDHLFKLFQRNWDKHFAVTPVPSTVEKETEVSKTHERISHLVSLSNLSLLSSDLSRLIEKEEKNIKAANMTLHVLAKEDKKKINISLSKKDGDKKKSKRKKSSKKNKDEETNKDKSKNKSKSSDKKSRRKKRKDKGKPSEQRSEGGTAIIEAAGLKYLASRGS